ncbi:hypothetical protein [Actinoallomurus rhizosphaericola]|uniref:hypothetical protein n=1 Tax=Actinoallomurus rhizosphaericola TaxID=2952536 RepID=UPI002093372E|nr:hypothetical protein [Actinoallomurus rhizosphaericola]MCO5997720.1 hypothetical protein [Actinoallomurus rhizosphaericola]
MAATKCPTARRPGPGRRCGEAALLVIARYVRLTVVDADHRAMPAPDQGGFARRAAMRQHSLTVRI